MVRRDMWNLAEIIGDYVVVNGYCPNSPDMMADLAAVSWGWAKPERHPADWKRYGNSAGYIRNEEMANTLPDLAMGYILEESNGSENMYSLCQRKDIPTKVRRIDTFTDYGFPGGV